MEHIPIRREEEEEPSRLVEPEVMGIDNVPPEPTLWQRFVSRAFFSLFLGGLGLVLAVVGGVLTVTIIGAGVGIPLLLIGLFLMLAAVSTAFMR